MNIFTNYVLPDIFFEILSHLYKGPLTDNVMNLFSTTKFLRQTYLKQFCNYIRFQKVPLWIPNEYIKHGLNMKKKIERKELEEDIVFSKRIKIENLKDDMITLLKEGKVQLTSYKIDYLNTDDYFPEELPLKELYIKNIRLSNLLSLKLLQLEKLVVENLYYGSEFWTSNKKKFAKRFPNLRYIKINPNMWVSFTYPPLVKELVLDNKNFINEAIDISLPEGIEILNIGPIVCRFKNFPKSIRMVNCGYKLPNQIVDNLRGTEYYEPEKFFKEPPLFTTREFCTDNRHMNSLSIKQFLSNIGDPVLCDDCCEGNPLLSGYCVVLCRRELGCGMKVCHLNVNCIWKIFGKFSGFKLNQIELHRGNTKIQFYSRNCSNHLKNVIDYVEKEIKNIKNN